MRCSHQQRCINCSRNRPVISTYHAKRHGRYSLPKLVLCRRNGICHDERDLAKVEFSGVRRNVNITLVRPDGADVGKWVLVHVGFALRVIDEEEAAETLRFLEMIGEEFREEMEQINHGADPLPDLATQSKADP